MRIIHFQFQNDKYYVPNQDKDEKNGDGEEEEEEIINEVCESLYEESAKCNAFLPYTSSYYDNEEEDGDWEASKNPIICSFIETVQKKNIDKYGYVHFSKNRYYGKYVNIFNNDVLPEGYNISDGVFLGIVGGMVAFIALIVYSFTFNPYKESPETKELKTQLV